MMTETASFMKFADGDSSGPFGALICGAQYVFVFSICGFSKGLTMSIPQDVNRHGWVGACKGSGCC